jgi:hypothetical protein
MALSMMRLVVFPFSLAHYSSSLSGRISWPLEMAFSTSRTVVLPLFAISSRFLLYLLKSSGFDG